MMIKNFTQRLIVLLCFVFTLNVVLAQVPHPDLGLRADWMRGSYGLNWKPVGTENGKCELDKLTISDCLFFL